MLMYIISILFFVLYLYCSFLVRSWFFNSGTIFISSKMQYIYSFLYVVVFCIFFIFFFRFLRIFLIENSYIDLIFIKKTVTFYVTIYGTKNFLLFMLSIYFVFFFFRKLLVSITKYHFLRLYYMHYVFFAFYIDLFLMHYYCNRKKIDNLIFYSYLIFLFLFIFFLTKCIFFDKGFFYSGFLIYYALYIFFLNCFKFLCQLNSEFDVVSSFVYKGLNVSFEGYLKLKEYHMYLVLNESDYIFLTKYQYNISEKKTNLLYLRNNSDFFF